MPQYLRSFAPGGTFFFTLVTHCRNPILTTEIARQALRRAIDEVRRNRPFDLQAVVLLPEHLHCIWRLPDDDHDFSTRWRIIKAKFSRYYGGLGGVETPSTRSRLLRSERSFLQRRFWEHAVRNEKEYEALCHYIHYNPVKHGHATCPHAWPHSSFSRLVREGMYDRDWCCTCAGPSRSRAPDVGPNVTGE